MTKAKKIGIIILLAGICLPTATLPFITEFHLRPDICLTSNFFGNMGNMIVAFGAGQTGVSGDTGAVNSPFAAIPYKYLFAIGVILTCVGIGITVLSPGKDTTRKS